MGDYLDSIIHVVFNIFVIGIILLSIFLTVITGKNLFYMTRGLIILHKRKDSSDIRSIKKLCRVLKIPIRSIAYYAPVMDLPRKGIRKNKFLDEFKDIP